MANIAYTEQHVSGSNDLPHRPLHKVAAIVKKITARRTLGDLSHLDALPLNDLGLQVEAPSMNEGATSLTLANRYASSTNHRDAAT